MNKKIFAARHTASMAGIMLAVALLLAGMANSSACEIVLGWEPWPPYTFEDEDGAVVGVDGELINAVAARMGCQLEWVKASWQRQLIALEAGEYDAILGASHTDARAVWGRYSQPYRQDATHLIVAKHLEGRFSSLEEFLNAGKVLGVVSGYQFGETASALIRKPKYRRQIRTTFSAEVNMKKLAGTRVDGAIMERFVANHFKHQLDVADKVADRSIALNSENLHVLFSKVSTSDDMVTRFNTALTALNESGIAQQIYDKYSRYSEPKTSP